MNQTVQTLSTRSIAGRNRRNDEDDGPMVILLDLLGIPGFFVSEEHLVTGMTGRAADHPYCREIVDWVQSPRTIPVLRDVPFSSLARQTCGARWRSALIQTRANPLCVAVGQADPECASAGRYSFLVIPSLPDSAQEARVLAMQSLYGLSDGEKAVLAGLARGRRPREIASERQVSENTIRSQIRAILEKTGARSIQETLTHLACFPPVFATTGARETDIAALNLEQVPRFTTASASLAATQSGPLR